MAISQTITTLPDAPVEDSVNFRAEANTFVGALPPMVVEINEWAGQANALATALNAAKVEAVESAGTATEQASIATTKATEAKGYRDEAAGWAGSMAPMLSGSGVPSDASGSNGQYYLDLSNGYLYLKAADTWGSHIAVFKGADGADGANGTAGIGVPIGGTTGQTLKKASSTDYDTEWGDAAGNGLTDVRVTSSGSSTVATRERIFATAAIARALPASPVDGSEIEFWDAARNSETYNITVAPGSGDTIAGESSLVLAANGTVARLVYDATVNDWSLSYTLATYMGA